MRLSELETKQKTAADAALAMVNERDSAGTEFTPEQLTRFNALADEADSLQKQIDAEKKAESLRKQTVLNKAGKDAPEAQAAKRFSWHRAISLISSGRHLDGVEAEMDQEAEKQFTQSGKGSVGNLRLPDFMVNMKGKNVIGKTRDLQSSGSSAGDELVEDLVVGHIYGLNVMPKVLQLGAKLMTGLTGDVHFTKTGVATAVWASTENVASTETTPSTARVTMTPKRATAFTDISKTLLAQKPGFVDQFVSEELSTAVQVLLDSTAINGAGSGGAPTGLLNMSSGINSVAMGDPDGGAPTRAKFIEMWKLIAEDNADLDTLALLTTPGVKSKALNTNLDSGSGLFIWGNDDIISGAGVRGYTSNNVPSTLSKGNTTGSLHAAIMGVWNQMFIGQWGGIDLTIDPYSRSKEFLIYIVINALYDINVRHQQAFCYSKDIAVV